MCLQLSFKHALEISDVRELVKDGSSHLQNVSTKFKLCMKKLRDIQKDESQ
jgi:hypothetical protein